MKGMSQARARWIPPPRYLKPVINPPRGPLAWIQIRDDLRPISNSAHNHDIAVVFPRGIEYNIYQAPAMEFEACFVGSHAAAGPAWNHYSHTEGCYLSRTWNPV